MKRDVKAMSGGHHVSKAQVRELRWQARGIHPNRVHSPKACYRPGQPLDCFAEILVVAGKDSLAVSMNGSAVFSKSEWRTFLAEVTGLWDGFTEG